jgi:serine/threonine-protein kinase
MPQFARLAEALADRYRIERELGAGGMATVFLAEDLRHRRRVAVKVLRPELAAVIGADRFLAEIRTTANLQHPNILPLFDSGGADSFLFYVMPYVEGESLRDRLNREKQLPVGDAVRIASEVASALDYAHRHGVVHRDIKPENILLQEGRALVADFGIALAVTEAGGSRLTETGLSLGTPMYMSPEQATGEREITARADVYSLGAVTYEMLLGEPPFTGPSAQAIVAKVLTEDPRPLTAARRTVPPAVEDAVLSALEKLPADRPVSAASFAAQLAASATGTGGMPRTRGRRRSRVVAVGTLLLAGAAGLAGGLLLAGRDGSGGVQFGQATRLSWAPGLELEPAISPDGRFVAYDAGTATHTRVYVRQISGERVIPLTRDSLTVQSAPTWSPDGTRILYLAAGAVFSAPSSGGPVRQEVRRRPGNPITSAEWARDGRTIAFTAGDSLFVQTAGDTARFLAIVRSANNCRWAPDGGTIACASGNASYVTVGPMFGNLAASSIVAVAARDGQVRLLTEGTSLNQTPVWSPDGRLVYFISNRHGPRDIYAVRASGGAEPERLTTGLEVQSISISSDGTRLAYSILHDIGNIWSVALGRSLADAAPVTRGTQPIDAFSVSDDGKWVMYSADLAGNGDIYRIPASGGEPERLTTDPSGDFAPSLSPGPAQEMAFQSWRGGTRDIYVLPLDGGALQTVVATPRQEILARWSPDATRIAFSYFDAVGGIAIVRRRPDGSWEEPVQRAPFGQWPAWSPDGRRIAFTSTLSGGSLYMVPSDSGPAVTLVDATRPGMPSAGQPHFSADGKAVLFLSYDASGMASIWSVPVTGGEPRRVLELNDPARPVYRPYWALGAGRIFIIVQEQQTETWVVDMATG